jgi:hypothetical protein
MMQSSGENTVVKLVTLPNTWRVQSAIIKIKKINGCTFLTVNVLLTHQIHTRLKKKIKCIDTSLNNTAS